MSSLHRTPMENGRQAIRSSWFFLLVGCAAAACADRDHARGIVTIDSAGVRIVELDLARLPLPPIQQLAHEPDLELSNREDDPRYHFVDVSDAVSLPDGGIVVAIAGLNEIRRYDPAGRYIQAIGRQGSGPGEFRGLSWLAVLGDSIVAADRALRRVTVFDRNGRTIATATTSRPSEGGAPLDVSAVVPVGVTSSALVAVSYSAPAIQAGSSRPRMELSLHDLDGSWRSTVGAWPGDELYLLRQDGHFAVLTPPFQRSTRVVVDRQHIWIADTEQGEVQAYSPTGNLITRIRGVGRQQPVTPERLAGALQQKYRHVTDVLHRDRLIAEQTRIAEHALTPAIGEIAAAGQDQVWISDFAPGAESHVLWHRVRTDGQIEQRLSIPHDMRVLRFGPEHVLVVSHDEFDREDIRRYRIVNP